EGVLRSYLLSVAAEILLEAAEDDIVARLELDHELHPLRGSQRDPRELDRLARHESVIGRDQPERPIVAEADVVETRVGPVEQPESGQAPRRFEHGTVGAIDEDIASHHTEA